MRKMKALILVAALSLSSMTVFAAEDNGNMLTEELSPVASDSTEANVTEENVDDLISELNVVADNYLFAEDATAGDALEEDKENVMRTYEDAILIDPDFVGTSQAFGQTIKIPFFLYHYASSLSDVYYINIYDENQNKLGYNSGNFPSGTGKTKLTITWDGCKKPGKYYANFYSLLNTKYRNSLFPFYVVPQGTKNLKAYAAGMNKVSISWSASEGANGYLIYGKNTDSSYHYIGMTSNTSYTDTKASKDQYNFYWVYPYVKVDQDGQTVRKVGTCDSPYVYAKGTCPSVTNLRASSVQGGVRISWSKSTGADGYAIYGKNSDSSYHYIGATSGTSFTDKKASKTAYNFYWVAPYSKSSSGKPIVGKISSQYVYGKAK